MTKTHFQFVSELLQVNPSIEVIGLYTRATDRVEVRCKNCGKIWSPLAYSLSSGKGCPHCSSVRGAQKSKGRTKTRSHTQFCQEIKRTHPDIVPLDTYTNNKESLRFHCLRCNHIWQAKPYSLLQGHGCPRCSKSGTSFMEQFILRCFQFALGEGDVISRDRELIGMEIDILIPKKQLAIEPGNWALHKKSLKRDIQKRNLCSQKGINLITIYDKYPLATDPPFTSNCFVFSDDLNKSDHSIIKDLVKSLFSIAQINRTFSDTEWKQIESEAYGAALAKTHAEFVKELQKISPTIQVIGNYTNSNIRLQVKCRICGYTWDAVPASLLSGDGCRKCGTKKAHEKTVKSNSEFIEEVAICNPSVEIIGQYKNRHSPVKTRCKICGYEWEPIAASLLRGSNHKGSVTIHKRLGL